MDEDRVLATMKTFCAAKQMAFALLTIERMWPCLMAFSRDTGFDASCYRRGLEKAWMSLEHSLIDESLIRECLDNAPETEDFSHELTSCALNAALATVDILEFSLDRQIDHIANILALVRDSIDLYLRGVDSAVISSPEREKRIAADVLVLLEQRRDEEDMNFLSALPDRIDDSVFSALKRRVIAQTPLLSVPL